MIRCEDVKKIKAIKTVLGLKAQRVEHKSCSTVTFSSIPQNKKFEYFNILKETFPQYKVWMGYLNENISVQFN